MATTKKSTPRKSTAKKKVAPKKTVAKKPAVATSSAATKKPKTTSAAASKKNTAKSKSKTTSKVVSKNNLRKGKSPLRWLHIFGAVLSAVLAVLAVLFGRDANAVITSHYLAENVLSEGNELLPAITELFSLNLTYVIAAILAAAAVWRILLLTKLSNTYQTQVKKEFISLHWIELSLFAPLMFIVAGVLVGVRDIMTLLLLAAIPAGIGVLGYLSDRYNMLQNGNWLKTKIAIEALLLPWFVIGTYLLHTYIFGFVTFSLSIYAVLGVFFIVYCLLAIAHKKQILRSGKFANFMYGEKVISSFHLALYILLAIFAFI